jgi:hypothetical protein
LDVDEKKNLGDDLDDSTLLGKVKETLDNDDSVEFPRGDDVR